jgi:hypothetical protein
MRGSRRLLFITAQVIVSFLVLEQRARADGGDGTEGRALAFFEEGRAEMRDGHYAEACARFADSKTLDPGAGTMLNLAYCYEKLGKKARAWSEYESAAAAAHRAGKPEWESAARARAAQLEGKVGWVVVHLDDVTDTIDIEIRIDGEPLAISAADRPTPTDLGHHEVSVRAMGKRAWSTTFEVDEQHVPTIEVPPMEPVLPPTPAIETRVLPARTPANQPPAKHRRGTQRIAAVALAAFGAVALGVAAGFALSARSTYDGAACSGTLCMAQGQSARDSAFGQAAVATVAATTGLSAAAGAGILWWTARVQPQGAQAEPTPARAAWGLSLSEAW